MGQAAAPPKTAAPKRASSFAGLERWLQVCAQTFSAGSSTPAKHAVRVDRPRRLEMSAMNDDVAIQVIFFLLNTLPHLNPPSFSARGADPGILLPLARRWRLPLPRGGTPAPGLFRSPGALPQSTGALPSPRTRGRLWERRRVAEQLSSRRIASVMRSAGLPVVLIGSPINFAGCLIGSPVTWHYTACGISYIGFRVAV